jgi:hypothetical protein
LQKGSGVWETEGEVEILNGLTGGAFADVVLGTHEDDLVRVRIVCPSDVDEVGADNVFGVGALIATEQSNEWLIRIGCGEGITDLIRGDTDCQLHKGGGADACVNGH